VILLRIFFDNLFQYFKLDRLSSDVTISYKFVYTLLPLRVARPLVRSDPPPVITIHETPVVNNTVPPAYIPTPIPKLPVVKVPQTLLPSTSGQASPSAEKTANATVLTTQKKKKNKNKNKKKLWGAMRRYLNWT
jgi:hypothetical protein